MRKSKDLINKHLDKHLWLSELDKLILQIDKQSNYCGDTLVECSKSFVEAIAKNIILKLRPHENTKEINFLDLGSLIKKAKEALLDHSEIQSVMPKDHVEHYFVALNQWGRFLGLLRNSTGEVSHGKILPKPYSIDMYLAQVINSITDGFSVILISLLIQIEISCLEKYVYDKYDDFNALLDEQFDLPSSLSYSKALYDQDYDAYSEELDNYLDARSRE